MNKQELKDQMEYALEKAKTLIVRDGKLVPVALLHFDNQVDVIGLSFKNEDEKNRQLSLLKTFVKMKKSDSIIVVIETWYVLANRKNISIKPSRHPMRKESILVYGECEEGSISIMQIFDKINNKIIFGEKIEFEEAVSYKFDFGIADKNKKQDEYLRNLS